ncbi:asparagine synthase-domain-containing protein [Flammula alnicola]|nr:asparagine synthase-domain-containing protein [Flammula alnicola]
MCGIFVSVRFSTPGNASLDVDQEFTSLSLELQRVNAARGPDAQNTHALSLLSSPPPALSISSDSASFISSEDVSRSLDAVFYASELRLRGDSPIVQPHVRNGNVLCWNGEIFEGIEISSHENDGSKLFDLLCSIKTPEGIRDVFCSIEGPYAFAFYHESSQRLYFGRDPLGRRSLLIHKPRKELPYLLVSSVSAGANPAYDFAEISTEHIYSLDLGLLKNSSDVRLHSPSRLRSVTAEPDKVNSTIPLDDVPLVESLDNIPEHLSQALNDFIFHLDKSVMLQVRDIPRSSLTKGKARLAVLFSGGIDSSIITFLAHKHVPLEEPIDLLNVAFENPRKIRIQKEGNVGGVSKRVRKPQTHLKETKTEQERVPYMVPDRITGMLEVEELRRICPGRVWNFARIFLFFFLLSLMMFLAARPEVESLMSPGRTVMDLSLALALYFASRGQGQIRKTPESVPEPYTSEARVLLNGLGSDELLGGYGRHRSVYNTGGWAAAITELQQEIDRIPNRNLGRDDRVISSHGKETRHPFLSLSLVSFLASLPVHFKMDPRLETSIGDKMLLRLAARKLGLVEASSRKKRAMQFGSHSARMDGERRGDVDLE